MQINRLIEIVYVLLRQDIVTAKKLAERFDVSQRTIYRDIDTLSLAGIPVYTEKGKGGGIRLLPDFVLNKSILNEKEQNEILTALQGLSSIKADETNHVLNKLSAVFNKNATNWLEVDFSEWGYMNGDYYNDIKTAILERRIIRFEYYSTYGELTLRHVEPMQIWFKARSWYIKGFCLKRNAMRLFKMTRIKNLTLTYDNFSERDLLTISPSSEEPRPPLPDVDLMFKIAPEMTYRVFDVFGEDFFEKQPDGSFVVQVSWPEDDWVYGFILSFGEYIEVIAPKHIREIIHKKAQKLADRHFEIEI